MPSAPALPLKADVWPSFRDEHGGDAAALIRVAVAVILAVTLWRLGFGLLDATELSTDEAQYWAFGQDLAFGAYSKPPLNSWIIRAATEVFGDTVWAVRLPAALIHAATALVLVSLGRRIVPPEIAAIAALVYLTTPAVAVGSAVMTTDTPLLLAAAVALRLQADLGHKAGGSVPLAIGLGLAVGMGFLAKYAMFYAVIGLALAAALSPAWRMRLRDLAVAIATAGLVVLPHVLWLAAYDFVTFYHLSQSAGLVPDLAGWRPDLSGALRFVADQFIVMGPVMFPALVVALSRARPGTLQAGLAAMAAVPLLIVVGQALAGKALANWAVVSLIPAALLVTQVLIARPRLLAMSLGLGLAVSVALPVVKLTGPALHLPNGTSALKRYLGHAELSGWILSEAQRTGATVIVARDRDLLADLQWFTRSGGPQIRALPPESTPAHHWELMFPFNPAHDKGTVLLVLRMEADTAPQAGSCAAPSDPVQHTAGPGFAAGRSYSAFVIADPGCLSTNGTGS